MVLLQQAIISIKTDPLKPTIFFFFVMATATALLAALVSGSVDSLQVALAHLMFNVTGIIIWYPVPFMRRIPLKGAEALGKLTRIWRGFPLLYIGVCFFLVPLFFFGLSELYTGAAGLVALGILLTFALAVVIVYTIYWCRYKDGQKKTVEAFARRQRKNEAIKSLPEDMETLQSEIGYLKRRVQQLMEHTGAPEEDDDEEQQKFLENADVSSKTTSSAGNDDDEEVENEIQT